MALCGFNKNMLNGLTAFNEGLIEHGLQFRSQKNGETIDQALKREVSDMTRLLAEINRIDESGKRILTEGLVKYAMAFYLIIRARSIENNKKVIKNIGEYFAFMDNEYYSKLEGSANDMKELATLLNKKEI